MYSLDSSFNRHATSRLFLATDHKSECQCVPHQSRDRMPFRRTVGTKMREIYAAFRRRQLTCQDTHRSLETARRSRGRKAVYAQTGGLPTISNKVDEATPLFAGDAGFQMALLFPSPVTDKAGLSADPLNDTPRRSQLLSDNAASWQSDKRRRNGVRRPPVTHSART